MLSVVMLNVVAPRPPAAGQWLCHFMDWFARSNITYFDDFANIISYIDEFATGNISYFNEFTTDDIAYFDEFVNNIAYFNDFVNDTLYFDEFANDKIT